MKKVMIVILVIVIITAIALGNEKIRETVWPAKLTIVDQGYSVNEVGEKGSEEYGINLVVRVKNSNKYKTSIQPIVVVTTMDNNGKKINTEQMSLPEISPSSTITYVLEEEMISSEKPEKIKCKIYPVPFQWSSTEPKSQQEEMATEKTRVIKAKEDEGDESIWICGDIMNPNEFVEYGTITVALKDSNGNLVGGYQEPIESIKANDTTPFMVEVDERIYKYDYEISVVNWQ